MVELKKVVSVQNIDELKHPPMLDVDVERSQPEQLKEKATPDKTDTVLCILVGIVMLGVPLFMANFLRSHTLSEHAHLQGQIQQIKGLYDQAGLPAKSLPNHLIYPEAEVFASEEFRLDMEKHLNEQQHKLREIGEQSAAGESKARNNGSHTQH